MMDDSVGPPNRGFQALALERTDEPCLSDSLVQRLRIMMGCVGAHFWTIC